MISNMKFVLFVNQLWEQGVNRTLPRLLNAALNTSNSDKRLFCRQVLRVWVNQIELFCAIPSSFWLQYDAVTCISVSIYTVPSVTSTPFVFRDHLMQKAVELCLTGAFQCPWNCPNLQTWGDIWYLTGLLLESRFNHVIGIVAISTHQIGCLIWMCRRSSIWSASTGDNFYDRYGLFSVSLFAQLNKEAQAVPLLVPGEHQEYNCADWTFVRWSYNES